MGNARIDCTRFWTTVILLCVLACSGAIAGREADSWYFGDSVYVHFDGGGAISVGKGNLSTSEGCAAWSNSATGQPQLYTNGLTVWNGAGTILTNGTGLLGHESSTQSALLVPHPGGANRVLLFTAGAGPYVVPDNNGIRYSVVDTAQNTVFAKNTLLLQPATEKLVATPHCNGRDYWVVGHEWGTNAFYAWQINASGVIAKAVISSTGTIAPQSDNSYTIGFLKISPDGRRLVSTGYYPGAVQVFDFNNSTGAVSNPITLPADGSVYGASFSPDNRRLYIADQRLGTQSLIRIYQYTVGGTPGDVLASRTPVLEFMGGVGDELGALQLASDGKIYCAREGGLWLGVINSPNALGAGCNYVHNGLNLGGRRSLLGLPNCIDAAFNTGESCQPPQAMFRLDTTVCAGMCIDIRDESLNQPASWRWEFPGGTPSVFTGQHPGNICYYTPGVYSIRLIVSNSRGADTLERTSVVHVLPRLGASAGADTAVCAGSSVVLAGRGGTTYRWQPVDGIDNPNSATTIARPKTTTAYILTVQEGTCTDRDTVLVTVHPAPVITGGNYTLCSGDSVRHEAAGSAGTYHWEPAMGVSNPDTSAPFLFPTATTDYTVTLVDVHGCSTSAVVRVEVSEAKVYAGHDVYICRGSGVELRAHGLQGAYTWIPPDGLDNPHVSNPIASPLVSTTYIVIVTGGSCTAIDSLSVLVWDVPQVSAGEDMRICAGSEVVLRATASDSNGTYRWEPAAGVENPDSAETIARPTTTTTYRVTFTDEKGCKISDSLMVSIGGTLAVDAGSDAQLCAGDSVQLGASTGAGIYSWTPTTGLDNPASPRPKASPSATTVYRLLVQIDDCTGIDSVVVTVLPAPHIDVGDTVVICRGDTVQLRAHTDAAFVEWQPASTLDNALSLAPRAFPTVTTRYTAIARSTTGCIARDSVLVLVQPPAAIAEGDTAICAGSSIILHAVGEGPFTWEPAELVEDNHAAVVEVRPLRRTVFTLAGNGCTMRDSVVVDMLDAVPLTLQLPDTTVEPGVRVYLPVRAHISSALAAPTTIEFSIRYDTRLLDITGITRGVIVGRDVQNYTETLTIRIDNILSDSLLRGSEITALVGTALLASLDMTHLVVLDAFVRENNCVIIEPVNGRLRIDGYCVGHDLRLFGRLSAVVSPNPASDIVAISLGGTDSSDVSVAVQSLWGSVLAEEMYRGNFIQLSVSSLPAGVYYLVVVRGEERLVAPLCIVR